MASNFFSYTEDEASRIIKKLSGSREFLNVPAPNMVRKQLETLQKRKTDLELHGITLAAYCENSRIPRGLRIHLRPTLFIHNEEFKTKYMQILNKCSMDIMTLNIDFITQELFQVQSEIAKLTTDMDTMFPVEELAKMKEDMELKMSAYWKAGEEQKRGKFARDVTDYERAEFTRGRMVNTSEGTAQDAPVVRAALRPGCGERTRLFQVPTMENANLF
ncbi:hypothetical protein XELAEV_18004458mg [Xenopus laevis]|uniref:Uncharacterized protein n=1 Tax=Xenopus laevis TaxID=8355 RepID=A0A974BP84_XENLA|nr:hypothetical protein XELAEV_18004458mg [Xenopus laevis]